MTLLLGKNLSLQTYVTWQQCIDMARHIGKSNNYIFKTKDLCGSQVQFLSIS